MRGGWTISILAAVAAAVCACSHSTPPATTQPLPEKVDLAAGRPSFVYQELLPGERVNPDDSLRALIEVIRISAPAGSLSGSTAFWQAISDRALAPAQQVFLASNGVRMGMIEASAWPSLKTEIDRHVGVVSQTSTIRGDGRAELKVGSAPTQSLFFFDRTGRLQGRTFEDSQNFWGLRFAPDPADRGKVVLDLCPVVRSTRRQMRVTRRSNEYEVEYAHPEVLYEMGMKLQVPVGMAVVLAPNRGISADASSVGRAFLTENDPAGLMECVFVLYPRLYRLNAKATEHQFEQALQLQQGQQQDVGQGGR